MNYLFNGICLQNKRSTNMDSLLLKLGYVCNKNALLAVVCDGVGSTKDGAFASGTAARMLNEWFNGVTTADRIGIRMRDVVLEINNYIALESSLKKIDTASTVSVLLMVENDYYIVHVGDSRVYCYTDSAFTILTKDDISDSGKLTGYIGREENIFLQYSEGTTAGKTFLLCTDGLYKRIDDDLLVKEIKSWNKKTINHPMESLPSYVIERGEQDNITLALVRTEG